MADDSCLFCKIVSGKEPAWVVYHDRHIMALLDPFPMTRGHTLVIPVRHYEGIFDTPERLLGRMVSLAKKLSVSYQETLGIQGVSIDILNHRQKKAGFRHLHLHVIPRYDKNDPRDPSNVKPREVFPRETDANLDETLAIIKSVKL